MKSPLQRENRCLLQFFRTFHEELLACAHVVAPPARNEPRQRRSTLLRSRFARLGDCRSARIRRCYAKAKPGIERGKLPSSGRNCATPAKWVDQTDDFAGADKSDQPEDVQQSE